MSEVNSDRPVVSGERTGGRVSRIFKGVVDKIRPQGDQLAKDREAIQSVIDDVRLHPPSRDVPETHSPFPTDLVRDPEGGSIQIAQLRDDTHLNVEMKELIAQAEAPRPEPRPIPPQEVPQHAFDLLMSLHDAVKLWQPESESLTEEGEIVRKYTTTEEDTEGETAGKRTHFTVQLVYKDKESTTPTFGNVSVLKPTKTWPQEYYASAQPAARKNGAQEDSPEIYYDDYPHNQHDLGRPVKNDYYAVQRARELIAEFPRTT